MKSDSKADTQFLNPIAAPDLAMRRLAVSGLLSVGSQVIWGIQGFVTFVMGGRYLPPREFGFVVAANAVLFGAQCLILGPVTNPTLRLGAVSSRSARVTYSIFAAVTCMVCAAFFFGGARIGRLIYSDAAFGGVIGQLGIPFAALSFYAVQKLILFSRSRFGTVLAMDIVFTATNIAALILMRSGGELHSANAFYTARSAAAILGLIPAAYLYLTTRAEPARTEHPHFYKEYYSHAKYSLAAMLSGYGQGQVDALAVAHFLSPMAAAAYGAAKVFYTGIALVTTGLAMVVLPASSRLSAAGMGGMARLYRRALALAYALLLPACALLAVFAAPALRLCFGGRYMEAIPLVRIFCLAALVMPLSAITDAAANGAGLWRRACLAAAIGGAVGAAASLLLTPLMGIYGAAIAPVLALSAAALALMRLSWSRLFAGSAPRRQEPCALDVGGADEC